MREAGFVVEGVASRAELDDAPVHIRRIIVAPPSTMSLQAYWGSTPLPTSEITRGSALDAAMPAASGFSPVDGDEPEDVSGASALT
jgi:hypothetical protein